MASNLILAGHPAVGTASGQKANSHPQLEIGLLFLADSSDLDPHTLRTGVGAST